MRTILTIDDDVLVAVEAIARQEDRSLGEVITDLARRSLHYPQSNVTLNGIVLPPVEPRASQG